MIALVVVSVILGTDGPPEVALHFPTVMHAVVWRNWPLVPTEVLAKALKTTPERVLEVGRSMGLADPPAIDDERRKRSYITVIRRNWHLLPNEQIRELLEWDDEKFEFVYREDDFLYVKLGPKPNCKWVEWEAPSETTKAECEWIRKVVREAFPDGGKEGEEKPFSFIKRLAKAEGKDPLLDRRLIKWSPRICYSYFALYGDPLLEEDLDPYPDGYLEKLAASGVNGVWLQGVLSKLAPFPWDAKVSRDHERRLANLQRLCERAEKYGIGVYLYLNEPRAQPLEFFKTRPALKGAVENGYAALCTSNPEVRRWLAASVATVCAKAPGLGGFITITASENFTNCWSHPRPEVDQCARCKPRRPAEVFAEVLSEIDRGIKTAGGKQTLIAWDWGWKDEEAPAAISLLPKSAILQSVSEWDLPIERGGVKSVVGEYSLSAVGPGPRALRHWQAAKEAGLKVSAKIQANCTWELSSVPWIPCVGQTAVHASRLRREGIDAIQLGWTLGGHPSPNLDVVAEIASDPEATSDDAMFRVAARTFGNEAARTVVAAWTECSKGMREFPYHIGTVYSGPQQMGPANLLYLKPTGRKATMVCYPWDDLEQWRQVYPSGKFVQQLLLVDVQFMNAGITLRKLPTTTRLREELRMVNACQNHFRSVWSQASFIVNRASLTAAGQDLKKAKDGLAAMVKRERQTAMNQFDLQREDSRLGFEATNQYYYLPIDLMEKVVNCEHLLKELAK